MAEAVKVEVGDWATFRFKITKQPGQNWVIVDRGHGTQEAALPVAAIVSVEPRPLRDGDRVRHIAETSSKSEILRVRGETAVVLWDSGFVEAEFPLNFLVRIEK